VTTSVLGRVPADQITADARQVRLGETLLRLFAFLGIMLGRALGYAWLVPVWFFLAVRTGWRDVHPPKVSDGRAGAR
jgi:uncharacterized protein (DUF58 family)